MAKATNFEIVKVNEILSFTISEVVPWFANGSGNAKFGKGNKIQDTQFLSIGRQYVALFCLLFCANSYYLLSIEIVCPEKSQTTNSISNIKSSQEEQR